MTVLSFTPLTARHPVLPRQAEFVATVKLFDTGDEGKAAMERFESTADKAFSGRQMDELAPFGPCIAKK